MATVTQEPRRVLFVDDDPQFLETLKELMELYSGGRWEITTAESASRAFAVLQDHPIDLAVLDVQMGVMDGIQMLSLLNRGYPNVQKVVLTGFANDNYRAACLSNGVELFLEKPNSQEGWESLYSALNELLKYKPEEGFRGVLRRVGLQDVLQMECLARSSSILEISNAQVQGRIYVENGQIIHAEAAELSSEDAFNQMLGLTGGQFNLKPFAEPRARTISGPWEFLLMEAARKRDEAMESNSASSPEGSPPAVSPGAFDAAPVFVEVETGATSLESSSLQPGTETAAIPEAAPAGVTVLRPRVEELLICSAQGEVLHEWQCRNVDLWVNFFEFISQRAQRLAQTLPLGQFDRLEIQSGDSRAVVIISAERGVLVKARTGEEPVPAPDWP
ncbi:MAG: response regulator [Verrucomicrobia bacterium]|nr:response regulator [Verrucomicrobiota bacterium]